MTIHNRPSSFPHRRHAEAGANLALIAVSMAVLLGFMGIGIYSGLQSYVRDELQKAATTAALAGAAEYYKGGVTPTPQPGVAVTVATDVFQKVYNNTPALRSFQAKLAGVSTNGGAHTVTVSLTGSLPTPFLSVVGITKIDVNADASAKCLKYVPTDKAGMVVLAPPTVPDANIDLEFPLIDYPGDDMVTYSDSNRGYVVQACNSSTCYNIMDAETTGNTKMFNGVKACVGTCSFNLGNAGVFKATQVHFSWSGLYRVYINGQPEVDTGDPPGAVSVYGVNLYGYAGSCASPPPAASPTGLRPPRNGV